MPLGTSDRRALLARARAAIASRVGGAEAERVTDPPALRRLGTAFVSVYVNGKLRGCRGRMDATQPLGAAIAEIAVMSATDDPRFVAVTERELPLTRLVIQILAPARPVDGPEDIALGRHGIVLTKGHRSAVFLPNVATDFGWDVATTLSRLAEKAGLRADDWRSGATVEVFETEVVADADDDEGTLTP